MRICTINKIKLSFLIVFSFLVFFPTVSKSILAAPRLYFDPSSKNVPSNSEFEVSVKIDVESNSVFGTDAIVAYPGGDLSVVSVSNGGFFSDFSYANNSAGRLEIHAYFSSLFESKSGSGSVAVIKYKNNKESGNGTVSFSCLANGSDTSILDSDGNNILSCSSLNQLLLTYEKSGTGGTNPDEPNSCGGTCGSNINCKAGFFCYSGFCRNPFCPTDTDCVCPTATPKSTAIPKKTATPAPLVIVLDKYSTPSARPSNTPTPEGVAENEKPDNGGTTNSNVKTIMVAVGVLILTLALFIISKLLKKKKGQKTPPDITPPANPIDNPVTNPPPDVYSPPGEVSGSVQQPQPQQPPAPTDTQTQT